MNFANFIKAIVRSFRFVIVTALCITLLFSNTSIAQAIGTKKSAPTEATDQLNQIQKQTDEVSRKAPLGLEETQAKTQKGLNEVQGDADKDKMKRPENSGNATTVEEQIKDVLGKVTGDK
jgi:high-affinity K+ transport system ATPase subunit B